MQVHAFWCDLICGTAFNARGGQIDNAGQVVIKLFYIQIAAALVMTVSSISDITSGMPILPTSKIFENRYYGPVYGTVVSMNRFGGVAGTLLVPLIYDITKNYSVIWPVCAIFMASTLVAALGSVKLPRNKMAQEMDWEQPGWGQPP